MTIPYLREHQDKTAKGTYQSNIKNEWVPLIDVKSRKLVAGRYQLVGGAEISILNGGRGDRCQIRLKIDGDIKQMASNPTTYWQSFAIIEHFTVDEDERPDILIEYRLQGNGGDTAQARRAQVGWSNVGPPKGSE